MFRALALIGALLLIVLPAQGLGSSPQDPVEARKVFEKWLEDYGSGKIQLRGIAGSDRAGIEKMRLVFRTVAQGDDLESAKALWQAAIVQLPEGMDKHKLLKSRISLVRDEAKRLIAGIADDAVDDWLLAMALRRTKSATKQGDLGKMSALEILGMRAPKGMAEKLLAKINSLPIPERSAAILALERSQSAEALPFLVKLLKERAVEVRLAAVSTTCGILSFYCDETKEHKGENEVSKEWTPIVLEALKKLLVREKSWQVRSATIDGLVRLKNHQSIPILIDGYKAEAKLGKRKNIFIMENYHDGLVGLTGVDMPRNRPQFWEKFWQENGNGFRYAPKPKKGEKTKKKDSGGYVKYFNLDIRTKRILFIIDFSGSMREKVKLKTRYAGNNEHVKYELVKRELEKVIRALPKDAVCNVIFFNHEVSVWREGEGGQPALVAMNDSNKSDLLQYLWETNPGGSTNLYGALEKGLSMGSRGVFDKYYKTAYDSLFVLSDGAPSSGKITDTKLILREVAKTNKLRRIRIHSIVFGDATNNLRFMKGLAEQSGGQFHHVQ